MIFNFSRTTKLTLTLEDKEITMLQSLIGYAMNHLIQTSDEYAFADGLFDHIDEALR